MPYWPIKTFPHDLANIRCCGRLNNGSQRYPGPNPGKLLNITLYGERDFADVVKDLEMRKLFWITWMGPKYNHKCLYERDLM